MIQYEPFFIHLGSLLCFVIKILNSDATRRLTFQKNVPRGQIRGKWAFSENVDNQRLPFSLHSFDLSKLCNDLVKAMEWGCQSYALRASQLSSKRVKAYLWALQMPHVTILGVENEKIGAEKSFSYSLFFSRLNGKVDNFLSCFFVPFPFFLAFAHICITHSSQDYSMLAK